MCCCSSLPRRLFLTIAALGLILGVGRLVVQHATADEAESKKAEVSGVLDFTVESIKGDEVKLQEYYGDVILIVNVASKCGLTKQYKELQQLHEDYADKGLSILGFPANNFGKQEPGSNDEIAVFCEENYGVEFDMFAKVSVAGDDQAPLYGYLTSEETNPKFAGKIRWNFDKFLVSRDGEVIARFAPRAKPSAKEVVQAIEAALEKPVPDDAKTDQSEKAAE